jgi:chromosome segregation ATPase
MTILDEPLNSLQETAPREGLPYWIFWLLLCVILLLITFIFLRDKDLRRRLNSFLSGGKRKFMQLRIQVKLKKEKQKKVEVIRDLGRKAWSEDIKVEKAENIYAELHELEKRRNEHQKEWEKVFSKIMALNKQLVDFKQQHLSQIQEQQAFKKPFDKKLADIIEKENLQEKELHQIEKNIADIGKNLDGTEKEIQRIEENSKIQNNGKSSKKEEFKKKIVHLSAQRDELQQKFPELKKEKEALGKEKEEVQRAIGEANNKIKGIEEIVREQTREFEREIREWEKKKEKVQDRIKEIEHLMEPFFENLGHIFDELRVNHPELVGLYTQIDRSNKTILDLITQLENLHQ